MLSAVMGVRAAQSSETGFLENVTSSMHGLLGVIILPLHKIGVVTGGHIQLRYKAPP